MGTKRKTYDYDIPTIFFHCVGGGSCIALLLGYFLLDKNVNSGIKFFLYWTCASILAFTAGFYLRTISGISGWGFFSIIFASSEIFAGLVIQGLTMTYLFVTYQPGPDQISQIYAILMDSRYCRNPCFVDVRGCDRSGSGVESIL